MLCAAMNRMPLLRAYAAGFVWQWKHSTQHLHGPLRPDTGTMFREQPWYQLERQAYR